MSMSTRREMVKKALALVPATIAVAVSARALAAGTAAGGSAGALKLVAETDPTAKALKYVHDASKAKREKRGATEGKDQNCANCQLYTAQGKVDGKDTGKCLMINGGLVSAAGWCASWSKKA